MRLRPPIAPSLGAGDVPLFEERVEVAVEGGAGGIGKGAEEEVVGDDEVGIVGDGVQHLRQHPLILTLGGPGSEGATRERHTEDGRCGCVGADMELMTGRPPLDGRLKEELGAAEPLEGGRTADTILGAGELVVTATFGRVMGGENGDVLGLRPPIDLDEGCRHVVVGAGVLAKEVDEGINHHQVHGQERVNHPLQYIHRMVLVVVQGNREVVDQGADFELREVHPNQVGLGLVFVPGTIRGDVAHRGVGERGVAEHWLLPLHGEEGLENPSGLAHPAVAREDRHLVLGDDAINEVGKGAHSVGGV